MKNHSTEERIYDGNKKITFDYVHRLQDSYKPYFDIEKYKIQKPPLSIKHYDYFLHYLFSEFSLKAGTKPPKILEIGCNCGLFLDFMKKLGYADVTGIDIRKSAVKFAQKSGINAKLVDACKAAFFLKKNSFQLIFAINFFHKGLLLKELKHQARVEQWILKMMQQNYVILKKNGIFFCDLEDISLDVDKIEEIGFKLKYFIKKCAFRCYPKQMLIFKKC